MACVYGTPANPKTVDNIDGTPIKYGSPGNYNQVNQTMDTPFWSLLVDWRNYMNAVGAYSGSQYGSVSWYGHAGFIACKSGMHPLGRAMDLNYVVWTGGAQVDIYTNGYANPSLAARRRYLSVDACSRTYFRYVLDGWWNAAHHNHIHQDNTTAVSFSKSASSDVKFLQATLNNFNGASLATDGVWGTSTQNAYNLAKTKLGMVTDIWASQSAYRGFLQTVALKGLQNSAF